MRLRRPIAYLAVAGFCFVLHNAVMILAESVGLPLWLAVLLSFVVVAGTGYVLHSLFTFRRPLALLALANYALAMSLNIPLAFVTTWFFHEQVGLAMPVAAPLASGCMLALNYGLGAWAISAPRGKAAAGR